MLKETKECPAIPSMGRGEVEVMRYMWNGHNGKDLFKIERASTPKNCTRQGMRSHLCLRQQFSREWMNNRLILAPTHVNFNKQDIYKDLVALRHIVNQ